MQDKNNKLNRLSRIDSKIILYLIPIISGIQTEITTIDILRNMLIE